MDFKKYDNKDIIKKALIDSDTYRKLQTIYEEFWKDARKYMKSHKNDYIDYKNWNEIRKVNNSIIKSLSRTEVNKTLEKLHKKKTDKN
jgi:hypothetical protein